MRVLPSGAGLDNTLFYTKEELALCEWPPLMEEMVKYFRVIEKIYTPRRSWRFVSGRRSLGDGKFWHMYREGTFKTIRRESFGKCIGRETLKP